MFATIITDCNDTATAGRQLTRANSLFSCPANLVGVDFNADYQAAGNMIDILDAAEGREGVLLVNVAPRSGKAKKWKNGTPFGFFYYKNTLVVTTVDGKTLSLVKKLGLTDKIRVFDIPTVMSEIPNKLDIYPGQVEYIINTQFRSFEFLPRVAKWIWGKIELPVENMMIDEVEDIEGQIWWVDNFGNCKTTFLPEEIGFEVGKEIQFKNLPAVKCYAKLKDVPNGDPALVVGSSGIEGKRFVEFLVQGSSAANNYGLKVGDLL
jgi:hypothetical protein